MPPLDARTTPHALRIPVLIGLLCWAGYFAACAATPIDAPIPAWKLHGRWQMFTMRNDRYSSLRAMGEVDGQWVDLDLPTLFPTRWESGHRYDDFDRKEGRLRVLAAATCGRSPLRPTRIRFYSDRVKLRVGRAPKKDRSKERLNWDCADKAQLPKGTRW